MRLGRIAYLERALDLTRPRYVVIYPTPAHYIGVEQPYCGRPSTPAPSPPTLGERIRIVGRLELLAKRIVPPAVTDALRSAALRRESREVETMARASSSSSSSDRSSGSSKPARATSTQAMSVTTAMDLLSPLAAACHQQMLYQGQPLESPPAPAPKVHGIVPHDEPVFLQWPQSPCLSAVDLGAAAGRGGHVLGALQRRASAKQHRPQELRLERRARPALVRLRRSARPAQKEKRTMQTTEVGRVDARPSRRQNAPPAVWRIQMFQRRARMPK